MRGGAAQRAGRRRSLWAMAAGTSVVVVLLTRTLTSTGYGSRSSKTTTRGGISPTAAPVRGAAAPTSPPGQCVDNPAFKDDQGLTCADWRKLGPGHCERSGDETFFGLKADAECCVCRSALRQRTAKAPGAAEAAEKLKAMDFSERGECPAGGLAYPHCNDLSKLPTSVSADGSVTCEFGWEAGTFYMPSPRVLRCMQEAPPREWDHHVQRFHRAITKLQNPESCGRPRSAYRTPSHWKWENDSFHYSNEPHPWDDGDPRPQRWHVARWMPHGHGFNLFMMTWVLGNHWDRGVPMLISNNRYRFGGGGCGRGWSCLLTKLSRCNFTGTPASKIAMIARAEPNGPSHIPMSKACRPNGKLKVKYGRCLCNKGYGVASLPHVCVSKAKMEKGGVERYVMAKKDEDSSAYLDDAMPALLPNLAGLGEMNPEASSCTTSMPRDGGLPSLKGRHGWFWWHSAVLWWLVSDAPMKPRLDAFVESVGIKPAQCIGIHVRRADACRDPSKPHRKCFAMGQYMDAARAMRKAYGLGPQVYMATDDPTALEELKAFEGEFQFVYQNLSRDKYNMPGVGVDDNPTISGSTTTFEIHRDLWALSHCGGFIGTFSSSLGWVAYSMMVMRHKHYRPFISLDVSVYNHKESFGKFVYGNRFDRSHHQFRRPGASFAPRPPEQYQQLQGEREEEPAEDVPDGMPVRHPLDIAEPGAAFAARCRAQAELIGGGTVFLTTVTAPFIRIAKARDWEYSLWGRSSRKNREENGIPLWVANENKWDHHHGRPGITAADFPGSTECFFDVFDASPTLMNYLTDPLSPVSRAPQIPGTLSLSDQIIDGKALVRKVVAWVFAARLLQPGAMLVWLDVDVSVVNPSVAPLMNWGRGRDVSYMPELPCWREASDCDTPWELPEACQDWRIDTGVVLFHLTNATMRLMDSMLTAYEGDLIELINSCLAASNPTDPLCKKQWVLSNLGFNDIYVFALRLHQVPLRHGWLSVPVHQGCRSAELPGGMCHPCEGGNGSLVLKYGGMNNFFVHHKGGTGIMAEQHARKRTQDREMELPRSFHQNLFSHVDKRLACGDPKAVYRSAEQLRADPSRLPFLRVAW
eukprot:TRINITY_DN9964_c0_g1_i1.p1 TRINITY_DN9964_c0_g1~~TRINITY_DN9964_c0_g1_i1.p1  ORF type:complete len:1116 (+),score=280.82 TRINITY_DN9964_c0_g1_i1:76-3348(+)